MLDLAKNKWPPGMRVIAGKERPHPGAHLRITDVDGHRITAFATNTPTGGPGTQLPDLELRHRRRARCEDRIRCTKDTGLTNLPLHNLDQNRIWCATISLTCKITAWMQTLALTEHPAHRWEPKRQRLRLLWIASALATTTRTTTLHLSDHAPWADLALQALDRLRTLTAAPAPAANRSPTRPDDPSQPLRKWNPAPDHATSPNRERSRLVRETSSNHRYHHRSTGFDLTNGEGMSKLR